LPVPYRDAARFHPVPRFLIRGIPAQTMEFYASRFVVPLSGATIRLGFIRVAITPPSLHKLSLNQELEQKPAKSSGCAEYSAVMAQLILRSTDVSSR
jgi:hypothetical protein